MKLLFAISFCFICLFLNKTFAQSNFIVEEGFHGSAEWLLNTIESNDGNYIATGYWDAFPSARVMKVRKTGQLIWQRMISYIDPKGDAFGEGYGIIKTNDNGFAISGSFGTRKMAIYKFGANDSLQWIKQYGDSAGSRGSKMVQTSDEGYMIAGWHLNSTTGGGLNSFIVKTDSLGNLQWSKNYFPSRNNTINDLQNTKDSNYIFLSVNEGDTDSSYIVKIDASGNVLWSKYFYFPLSEMHGYTILPTSDEGFLVTGQADGFTTNYLGYNGFVLKLDANGNLLWSKITNNANYETTNLYASVETNDGNYVVGGDYFRGTDSVFSCLLKIDKNGNLLWSKKFTSNPFSTIYSLMKTSENGYLAVGRTGDSLLAADGLGVLIKFDSNFNFCASVSSFGTLKNFGMFSTRTVSPYSINSSVYNNEIPVNITDSFIYKNLCNALPVNLLSFTAQKQNNTSLLQWQTANEINNSYFSVERSADSKTFSFIGAKQGLNNAAINNYSFTDNAPLKGINYYRLKQVDKDGTFTYSGIASVEFIDGGVFAVAPNPATNSINIIIPSSNSISEIFIYDVAGKKILHEQIAANVTSKQINVSGLASGVYNVVLVQNGKKDMMKLMKK